MLNQEQQNGSLIPHCHRRPGCSITLHIRNFLLSLLLIIAKVSSIFLNSAMPQKSTQLKTLNNQKLIVPYQSQWDNEN